MAVNRDLVRGQGHALNSDFLAELVILSDSGPLACVYRAASLQIRKLKGLLTVTAVSGSDQVEERVVLGNSHRLPLAHRPSLRGKAATKHSYFTYKRFS